MNDVGQVNQQEEQRRWIADACGWKRDNINECWESPDKELHTSLPDYHNDLNAMHEAEKTLSSSIQLADYCEALLGSRHHHHTTWVDNWQAIHSTAARRAELFCRTLWPERFKP